MVGYSLVKSNTQCFRCLLTISNYFSQGFAVSLHWGHDEDILYACADHNLLIPWDVAMTPGQSVTKIEWFFQGANSTIKIASLTNGTFQELSAIGSKNI